MIARDLMTPNPLTATPQASIAEAWDVMRELAVRHVPVVEPGTRDVLGIVHLSWVLIAGLLRLRPRPRAQALVGRPPASGYKAPGAAVSGNRRHVTWAHVVQGASTRSASSTA
jgi:CBS-domain-containing membrane protein